MPSSPYFTGTKNYIIYIFTMRDKHESLNFYLSSDHVGKA